MGPLGEFETTGNKAHKKPWFPKLRVLKMRGVGGGGGHGGGGQGGKVISLRPPPRKTPGGSPAATSNIIIVFHFFQIKYRADVKYNDNLTMTYGKPVK